VRLEIYRYALGTDARDNVTDTPILKIGERRVLRRASRALRRNRYSLLNFDIKYFALSQSCTQTRLEIQSLLPPPTYQFTSADTLGDFFGDRGGSVANLILDERAISLLCAAANVILSMNKDDLSAHQLWRVTSLMTHPFMMTFVNEYDAAREVRDGMQIWSDLMARFAPGP
jgi:hypothetical protein